MKKTIALKVDVDTFAGMRDGVPELLALFERTNVKASFFVPMGRDHTGRTVKRVFTRKGFLRKAGRVGVVETYGVKTLLYGLLLKGPEIALEHRDLLLSTAESGHEVGIHGLDHVYWHDHIKGLGKEETEQELRKAFSVYMDIFGQGPPSFAAPGWMINSHALRFFEEIGLSYSSDTRGAFPFIPVMEGEKFDVIQIPSTLPTLDEVVGIRGSDPQTLADFFLASLTGGLNVLTVHAELEGKKWSPFLQDVIQRSLNQGYSYRRLCDIARELEEGTEPLPVASIAFGHVEGRAGEVCLQGPSLP